MTQSKLILPWRVFCNIIYKDILNIWYISKHLVGLCGLLLHLVFYAWTIKLTNSSYTTRSFSYCYNNNLQTFLLLFDYCYTNTSLVFTMWTCRSKIKSALVTHVLLNLLFTLCYKYYISYVLIVFGFLSLFSLVECVRELPSSVKLSFVYLIFVV